jgi:hypothetical protein
MGVDVNDGNTQVAAVAIPGLASNDAGDVFGSYGSVEPSMLPADAGRGARPGVIALVIEDARARERLRRHLDPRFTEIVEADDAMAVRALDALERLDAIVCVRPSAAERNRAAFRALAQLSRRPRVLVISPDASVDGLAGVDLRLPLGQKASEVARQVLDGLEQLGVRAVAQ